jgi:DNA-binding response OmpR family regulator
MDDAGEHTVLVVDDEQSVADAYALRLRGEHEVRTAYGGEAALETIDDDVDVVLLDRRMPDVSGDGVLNELRVRGFDCAVIMVTAVEPTIDVSRMAFDEYLCKPVEKEALFEAVDRQLGVGADERLSEFVRVMSKLTVLAEEQPAAQLEESEEYARLRARAENLQAELLEAGEEIEAIEGTFQRVDSLPG